MKMLFKKTNRNIQSNRLSKMESEIFMQQGIDLLAPKSPVKSSFKKNQV